MRTGLQSLEEEEVAVETEQLCFGVHIPERVRELLAGTFANYPQYIETEIRQSAWHLSLVDLGEVENPKQYFSRLLKPLSQSFVPTVQLMYVGRGRPLRQYLWAYAEPTSVLLGVREQLIQRLKKMRFVFPDGKPSKEYIPHITLASLFPQVGHVGIADVPTVTSFSIDEVNLYKVRTVDERSYYDVVDSISLL